MNFGDQSIEMKRTLLESAVGRVFLSSHSLELNLKIILFSLLNFTDNDFDQEWEKPRTLGVIIVKLKSYDIFNPKEITLLDEAKELRNKFTHSLSENYISSINNNGTMFQLILEFNSIKKSIDIASDMVLSKQHEMAKHGGVNVADMLLSVRKDVDNWEKLNNEFK